MAVVVYVPSRLGEDFFTDLPAPTAGDDGKAITYNHGTGAFVYAAASGGTPPGSDTQVVFNDAGAYGADAGLTYAKTTDRLTVAGSATNGGGLNITTSGAAIYRIGTLGAVVPNWGGQFMNMLYNPATNNWTLDDTSLNAGFFKLDVRNNVNGNEIAFYRMPAGSTPRADGENRRIMGITLDTGRVVIDDLPLASKNIPTALLDLGASTTARASLRVRSGVAPSTTNADGDIWNDGSTIAMRVNGTNAVNTDGGLSVWMQSSTTARNVGRVLWQYIDKTDATRVTEGSVTAYYQSAEHKAIRWRGGSGGPLLSFYDVATPIARQVLATGAGATVDQVIAALQNLGLLKQS